jgi:hypothetical protein
MEPLLDDPSASPFSNCSSLPRDCKVLTHPTPACTPELGSLMKRCLSHFPLAKYRQSHSWVRKSGRPLKLAKVKEELNPIAAFDFSPTLCFPQDKGED